ncbi:glycolate oxidase subunit GlcF [Pelagibacterium lentulum]|uniref:Glycolate oxidase iron-sulfur subunit n=1 Tax=Pelagibacterium lentulum TaxID=2029865 RepID=A0A916R877_9HYPH|nr:glycolate oxidase subunit GlcF [Pelagibacterium lentulum]GGA41865.1 glycolate oxidase iron-sulfur subunit [Pelagibacterium lentulum]
MQTQFAPERLADSQMAESEKILRSCVHCGFCTATCPTYLLEGDELDSPRGRIYLIKDMLENDKPASADVVKHVDRCLSCLSCMTTCPSGVHYMHLVDHARAHIEKTYRRPLADRFIRAVLAAILPYPNRFRAALALGRLGQPLAPVLAKLPGGERLKSMLALVPQKLPRAPKPTQQNLAAAKKGRVALLAGCAQQVLDPEINAATTRLLNRLGIEIADTKDTGCCGALVHHMGKEHQGHVAAKRAIDAWWPEIEAGKLDAIIITASGCGTTIKDYGFMLRDDPDYAHKAKAVSELALDITQYLATLDLPKGEPREEVIAYHSACSMQHGQQIRDEPKNLLKTAGFTVKDVPEGHICCGSAGTYNILQPGFATRLRDRKVKNIERVAPDLIATGNIGCMTQIGTGTDIPIIHTIQVLDWAYGGPKPAALG